MYFEEKDMLNETRDNMRDGKGTIRLKDQFPKDALPPKARLVSHMTFDKGCSIGYHQHSGEEEMYFALSGEGVLDDNGVKRVFKAGDSHLCKDGESHAVSNEKDEPLKILAVIVLSH
jgi:quercetin dioxygenase-like cupin family protein